MKISNIFNYLRFVVLLSFFTIPSWSQAFITTWLADDYSIFIPTKNESGPYNYNIIWENLTSQGLGNGSFNGATGNYTISGLTNGHKYKVSITGVFPHFYMNNSKNHKNEFSKIKLLSIEQWGNILWKNMESAFNGCHNLSYNAIDIPNLSHVLDMSNMFKDCYKFYGNPSINKWDTSNVKNMSMLFCGTSKFNQPLNNWNTSKITNMSHMFYAANEFNQPLNNWDTSNVTNMARMFASSSFNHPIGNWNVSNVININEMFYGTNFNHPIGDWDTSKVWFMSGVFCNNKYFNQPICNWNTSNVTNMTLMFSNASSFNQPIDKWDTSSVTHMAAMFQGAAAFNQPIGNWNISNVTHLNSMFNDAKIFNQPIGYWNTSKVTNMALMFSNATSFNQPINNWDISNVIYMNYMFRGALNFNQTLSNWVLNEKNNLTNFFDDSGLDCFNYSETLIGWASNPNTPNGRILGAEGREYGTDAVNVRNTLINTKGWTITGDNPSKNNCSSKD